MVRLIRTLTTQLNRLLGNCRPLVDHNSNSAIVNYIINYRLHQSYLSTTTIFSISLYFYYLIDSTIFDTYMVGVFG